MNGLDMLDESVVDGFVARLEFGAGGADGGLITKAAFGPLVFGETGAPSGDGDLLINEPKPALLLLLQFDGWEN